MHMYLRLAPLPHYKRNAIAGLTRCRAAWVRAHIVVQILRRLLVRRKGAGAHVVAAIRLDSERSCPARRTDELFARFDQGAA